MSAETEARVARTLARFDALNAEDPNLLEVDGVARPRELVQAERLAAWVHRLEPQPSLALRLAARCQHLGRFRVPREQYAMDAAGYQAWRRGLAQLHADLAGQILEAEGWDEAVRAQVRRINLKSGIKRDAEVQTMEDALCLAFLEHEAAAFAAKHPREKLLDILRKTWAKMSGRGHAAALALSMAPELRELVSAALAG